MRKWWYRRVLIMILVFTFVMGSGFSIKEMEAKEKNRAVNSGGSNTEYVIPGGMTIGLYLETDGVFVLSTQSLECIDGNEYEPAKNLVKSGDYIVGLNGKTIEKKKDLVQAVNKLEAPEVVLKIRRNDEYIDVKMNSIEVKKDSYKLGIWVKDSVQGLGTLTYLTLNGEFGALGHGIHDAETNELLDIQNGSLYKAKVMGIQKGKKGEPGGLEGIIIYKGINKVGVIDENMECGIFGEVEQIESLTKDTEPIPICKKDDLKLGKATILCALDGSVKEYEIKIKNTNSYAKDANKGIVIEVTDEELLAKTGGIVQGMSGSPILQDGKIVGAVTHVLVNDPTRGYGIFIEDMLDGEQNAKDRKPWHFVIMRVIMNQQNYNIEEENIMKKYVDYIIDITCQLLAIDSPTGYTRNAAEFVMEEYKKMGYEPKMTVKGCVLVDIGGNNIDNGIVLAAHTDTLGAMVSEIKGNGNLKVSPLGGMNPNNAEAENCRIVTRFDGIYEGTFQLNNASIHVNADYNDMKRKYKDMEVVLDEMVNSKEDVEKLGIMVGDIVCFDPRTTVTKKGYIKSRFLDDKLSVGILLGYAKYLKENHIKLENRQYHYITVYEEVGHGGTASIPVGVTEMISVDMGCVGDGLSCDEHMVSICAKDSRGPYNYDVVTGLIKAAKDNNLNFAVDIYPFYGSDVDAALEAGYDIRHGLIGAGVYASHGYERSHKDGVENTLKLLVAYCK